MNITGKCKVWIKEFNGNKTYSTSISSKKQDGTYDNMYVSLQLPKDTQIENGQTIEVTKGFISMYKDKTGLAHPKLIVQEYEIEGEEQTQDYMYQGSDLPF